MHLFQLENICRGLSVWIIISIFKCTLLRSLLNLPYTLQLYSRVRFDLLPTQDYTWVLRKCADWRKLHNEELPNLCSSLSIIRMMRSRMMWLAGHVPRIWRKRKETDRWEDQDIAVNNGVFWVVTPCGSCKNRRFGETWRLLHQGNKNRWTRNNTSCN
jgi:hypothetical protein